MIDFFKNKPELSNLKAPTKSYKGITKNTPKNIDLNQVAYKYFGGVDLIQIEGFSHSAALSIMSEIGSDGFKKFQTGKQFASRLRLAPNNKISGGKTIEQ